MPRERIAHVFTHTSWAPDRASSYERLEFLGDSVLELAIAKELYDRYPDASEGRLAKIRSHVVSRQSCAAVARELRMGERLAEAAGESLAGEELSRIVRSRNVTAALLEAALAALFLEHGFEPIEEAVVGAFWSRIEYALTTHVDHKTELARDDRTAGTRDDVRADLRELALGEVRIPLVELPGDRQLEDAVAQELEPLVGRGSVGSPGGVREDVLEPVRRQRVDQPFEAARLRTRRRARATGGTRRSRPLDRPW